MSKMRVYEYAKQVDKSSKDIVQALKSKGVEVSNHMSVISDEDIKKSRHRQSRRQKLQKLLLIKKQKMRERKIQI